MSGVTCCHHVFGVKHLLCQFRNSEGSVLLATTGSQRGEARHEKVETREGNHVDSKFAEICVELTGEPEASCDTRHCEGHQMVQVSVGGGGQFQCAEANVV